MQKKLCRQEWQVSGSERDYATYLRLGACAFLLVFAASVVAAPAPFQRRVTPPARMQAKHFFGDWVMRWGGMDWNVTFRYDGYYTCGDSNRIVFTGTWRYDHDRSLWITESSRPDDPDSWRVYKVELCKTTLTGQCVFGSPGTEVKLRRR